MIVWIYGGAYKFGSSDDPAYDASRLARDGEPVVVTLNYRVDIEGFLPIEGAPANRGLLDRFAALEWVRENISPPPRPISPPPRPISPPPRPTRTSKGTTPRPPSSQRPAGDHAAA